MQYITLIICLIMISQSSSAKEAVDHRLIPVATKQPEINKVYPIAIIGAGAGGTMAVKRAILNNNETLLFTGAKQEQKRSRGTWVRKVDNIPGLSKYERTILELRNETLTELVQHPLGQQLYIIPESVKSIVKQDDVFLLTDSSGRTHIATYVVMATGIMDEQPHIQGSIKHVLKYANGQTIAYCPVCDGHNSHGKKTVIIGHTDSAANTALLLLAKYQPSKMTILTNGNVNEISSGLLKQLDEQGIQIIEASIEEVKGDKDLKKLTGFLFTNSSSIDADLAFVSLGIRPNNQLALQLGADVDDRGLVITDAVGESTVSNMFVVGDLRANSMKQIYTAWQQAVESVQAINRRIRDSQTISEATRS